MSPQDDAVARRVPYRGGPSDAVDPAPGDEGAAVVLPTRDDGLAAAASPVAGGPAGRRVRTGRHSLRGAVAAGSALGLAVLAVAVLLREHCRATLWAAPGVYTHACYSDVPALYASASLDQVLPYLERFSDQSPLTAPFGVGWLLWGLGRLVGAGGPDGPRDVFDASVVLGAVALVVVVAAVAHLSGRRPYDAVLVAGSPVLLACALVGVQLVPAALAVAALWASSRGRALAAGMLLGLAALLAPPVGLAVGGALLLVRWRRRRDDAAARAERPEAGAAAGPGDDIDGQEEDEPQQPVVVPEVRTAAVAALVWSLGGLPVLLRSTDVWVGAVTARVTAGPGYGSAWLLGDLAGAPPADATTTAGSVLLTAAAVAGTAVLALRAPRPPRVPVLALLLLLAVLAPAPALPPQAAVLVLPLAVLALPRWRLLLVWGAVEAAAATGTWLYLYGLSVPDRGLPPWAYAVLVVARLGMLLLLAHGAVRASLEPGEDVVRAPRSAPHLGADDPAHPPERVTAAGAGPGPL